MNFSFLYLGGGVPKEWKDFTASVSFLYFCVLIFILFPWNAVEFLYTVKTDVWKVKDETF